MKEVETLSAYCLIHQPRFHADEDCRESKPQPSLPGSLAQVAPRLNLFLTQKKILGAKFHALYHSVMISPLNHPKPPHFSGFATE